MLLYQAQTVAPVWCLERRIPQNKWDAKAGVISKTYKANKSVAEEFQIACKKSGVAMGTQLTNMMKEFIEKVNKEEQEASE